MALAIGDIVHIGASATAWRIVGIAGTNAGIAPVGSNKGRTQIRPVARLRRASANMQAAYGKGE